LGNSFCKWHAVGHSSEAETKALDPLLGLDRPAAIDCSGGLVGRSPAQA